jgi:hypothetical protein
MIYRNAHYRNGHYDNKNNNYFHNHKMTPNSVVCSFDHQGYQQKSPGAAGALKIS